MTAEAAHRRVLIVDENESVHQDFRQILGEPRKSDRELVESKPAILGAADIRAGVAAFEVHSAFRGQQGWEQVAQAGRYGQPFCIAFVDVRKPPGWDGIETASRILAEDSDIQVVLCAAPEDYSSDEIFEHFGAQHRVMLLQKPFAAAETMLLAASLSEKWRLTQVANARLNRQAGQITEARRVMTVIASCLDELEDSHNEVRQHAVELTGRLQQRTIEVLGTRDLAMFALAQLADSRDPETGEHLLRMRAYAQLLARQLAESSPYASLIDTAFLEDFYRSTPLHDIGKVGIPDQILLKPGPLSGDEFEIMKQHTAIGAEALQKASRQNRYGSFLDMAAQIARSHHERVDGGGYPDGLAGQDIPLSARITTVADVFDALTSSRVYKDAMRVEEAKRIIEAQEGKQFDPVIVEAFRACFGDFVRVKQDIDGGGQNVPQPFLSVDRSLPLQTPLQASGG